jgi:hypothetical protein
MRRPRDNAARRGADILKIRAARGSVANRDGFARGGPAPRILLKSGAPRRARDFSRRDF